MPNYIRKIFSDSIVYSLGYFLNRLMPFLLMPVYTYYFSPGVYGVYSLFYSFWMFIVIIYLFGMETSFQKFFIEAETESEKREIFSSTLLLILTVSVVFSTVVFLLADPIAWLIVRTDGYGSFVRIIAVLLVIDSLARLPMILLNSLERSKLYSAINLIVMGINVIMNIVLIVYVQKGIKSIFYAYIIAYLFLFIISFSFSVKYFHFKIDMTRVKMLVKFAGGFLLYGLFLMSMDIADRFIIEHFKGAEEVGIYSACYRIGVVMNLLILGFRTAWTPFFLNLKNQENNKEIFAKVFSYFCYAGIMIFLALSFFVEDLIRLKVSGISLLDEKYWGGLSIFPYVLLAYLFFGLYTNLNVASYFENKIKYLIISSAIGCVSNIVFNFILIPILSINGAAIATLLSYMLMFAVLYIFSQKTYNIPYDWSSILKVSFFAGFLFLAKFGVLNYINLSYFSTILVKFLGVLLFFLFLWVFKFVKLPKLSAKN